MQNDLVMPQIAVGTVEVQSAENQVTDIMVMEVKTGSTTYTFTIGTKETYRQAAEKIREGIMRAGAAMNGPRTKLITSMKELPDGLRRPPA